MSESSRLQARIEALDAHRQQLLAELSLPRTGLPGSLGQSRRRCGSPGCHCQQGEGHSSWTLTFMVEGKKRVEHVPAEMVEAVRERVERGNAFKQGVAELMAINAQLLIYRRRVRTRERVQGKKRGSR